MYPVCPSSEMTSRGSTDPTALQLPEVFSLDLLGLKKLPMMFMSLVRINLRKCVARSAGLSTLISLINIKKVSNQEKGHQKDASRTV